MVKSTIGLSFGLQIFQYKRITFALLKVVPHVKDWWETYYEQTSTKDFVMFGMNPTLTSFVDAIKEKYYHFRNYDD